MSRPRIVFCYRYGLLGGVSAQLINRYPYLSREFEVTIIYEQDHGMVSRLPAGAAKEAPTQTLREDAIRTARPDLIVVIDSPNFVDAWRAVGSPGRLVLEVHTTTANLDYIRRREQFAGVSQIVTVSSYMEQRLAAYGLDALAPITVIPNCLDDRWRQPSATPPSLDVKPVVWVGKLDGHKRWRTAVDLIDQLAEDERLPVVPILIGGLTSPEAEVNALTTRLATSSALSRGVWWPRVEYGRMPDLYSAVGANGGVHLCTSVNESFGMAVAESLVRECPVVAPAVGALPELLPTAALYRPGDWATARELTRRALTDGTFRDELLSSAGRVKKLTNPEQVVDAYRAVVEAALARA
jgi:glycosyltransferase involved in cell wall biosynthesis